MTNCPFSILAKESTEGIWTLHHRPDSRFSVHNHEPSRHASAHPRHRQLSLAEKDQLEGLTTAGVSPKEIQTLVRQGGSLATRKDVSNQIADVRRDSRGGQNPIHAFATYLQNTDTWSRIQAGEDGHVTAIIFAHRDSLTYLQAYPELLILDCTYKTNKFGLPLLDIIGVDACQRSFFVAFAFISGESEADYLWPLQQLRSLYEQSAIAFPSVVLTDRCLAAINAISATFPSATLLICIWHANKAVLAHCKRAFPDNEMWDEFYQYWHSIINSRTEDEYLGRLAEFQQKYASQHLESVRYVKETWLLPFKEKLVKAWVDQSTHFGNTATSRVEGIHALLKSYVKRSTI